MSRLKDLARASCERKVATCQGHDELPWASGHGSLILFYFFGIFYEPHAGFPEWLMAARASAHYLYCFPCEKTHTHTTLVLHGKIIKAIPWQEFHTRGKAGYNGQ